MSKLQVLLDFLEEHKNLPVQGSEQWLLDRKFTIGGSEIPTIVGKNPYSNIRELIEGHVGIRVFKGNIYTMWGNLLEPLVIKILEKKWRCHIYSTGSLPGVIPGQKYSPDGLVYLDFLNKIVLIEIKCAARRSANGKIPEMYKPQLFTGLDTIRIADLGIFVDAMFRRCPVSSFSSNYYYDYNMHSRSSIGKPLLLCAVCMYEEIATDTYDSIKIKNNVDNGWVDMGACSIEDAEYIFKANLKAYYPSYSAEDGKSIIEECVAYCIENKFNIIAILPLKLFKIETIILNRDDWKKKETELSYIETHRQVITDVIENIKIIDALPAKDKIQRLDLMYPTL